MCFVSLLQESASLADRLIQYQLTRAQEAEETYALKNELSLTKQKYTTTQKQLKEAESLIGDIKERVGHSFLYHTEPVPNLKSLN